MIAWLKSLGWVAAIGAAITAILLVRNAMKATALEKRAENAEEKAQIFLQDHTKTSLVKAEGLQAGAAADKAKAAELKAKSASRLRQLGEKDETLDSLADSFNSRSRMRD